LPPGSGTTMPKKSREVRANSRSKCSGLFGLSFRRAGAGRPIRRSKQRLRYYAKETLCGKCCAHRCAALTVSTRTDGILRKRRFDKQSHEGAEARRPSGPQFSV